MEAIERAIKTLNPRQRALLEGYYYNHKTMRELAERLGYSNEDVAKSTKNRIMNSIRTTIKQQERANRSRLSPAAFLNHLLIVQLMTDYSHQYIVRPKTFQKSAGRATFSRLMQSRKKGAIVSGV